MADATKPTPTSSDQPATRWFVLSDGSPPDNPPVRETKILGVTTVCRPSEKVNCGEQMVKLSEKLGAGASSDLLPKLDKPPEYQTVDNLYYRRLTTSTPKQSAVWRSNLASQLGLKIFDDSNRLYFWSEFACLAEECIGRTFSVSTAIQIFQGMGSLTGSLQPAQGQHKADLMVCWNLLDVGYYNRRSDDLRWSVWCEAIEPY